MSAKKVDEILNDCIKVVMANQEIVCRQCSYLQRCGDRMEKKCNPYIAHMDVVGILAALRPKNRKQWLKVHGWAYERKVVEDSIDRLIVGDGQKHKGDEHGTKIKKARKKRSVCKVCKA